MAYQLLFFDCSLKFAVIAYLRPCLGFCCCDLFLQRVSSCGSFGVDHWCVAYWYSQKQLRINSYLLLLLVEMGRTTCGLILFCTLFLKLLVRPMFASGKFYRLEAFFSQPFSLLLWLVLIFASLRAMCWKLPFHDIIKFTCSCTRNALYLVYDVRFLLAFYAYFLLLQVCPSFLKR